MLQRPSLWVHVPWSRSSRPLSHWPEGRRWKPLNASKARADDAGHKGQASEPMCQGADDQNLWAHWPESRRWKPLNASKARVDDAAEAGYNALGLVNVPTKAFASMPTAIRCASKATLIALGLVHDSKNHKRQLPPKPKIQRQHQKLKGWCMTFERHLPRRPQAQDVPKWNTLKGKGWWAQVLMPKGRHWSAGDPQNTGDFERCHQYRQAEGGCVDAREVQMQECDDVPGILCANSVCPCLHKASGLKSGYSLYNLQPEAWANYHRRLKH